MKIRRLLVFLLAVVLIPVVTEGTAVAETGRQTFVLSELPGDEYIRVTAGGPIRGVGIDEVISEDEDEATGQIIAKDVFRFGPTDAVFVTTYPTVTQEFTIDPRTCIGRLSGTLSWEITGGEGRYDTARGSGTGTFRVTAVLGGNPDGTCSESQEDEVAHIFIARLSGTATV